MSKVSARALGRNFIFASVGELWRIASRLILTPITIQHVGLEGYGVWTLLFSLSAYGSMFNVSFGIAYTKYTAEYDHSEDYEKLSRIIGSGITVIGGLSLVISAIMWAWRVPLLHYLNVPDPMLADAAMAFSLVVFCLLLRMSLGCAFDVLNGLQRADLNYKINLLGSFIEVAITLWLLLAGRGLMGLAIGYTVSQVVITFMAWFMCRRVRPQLVMSPFRFSREGIRKILILGGRFQALSFISIFFDQGVKIVLSRLLGLTSVGVYELAYKLLALGSTVSNSLVGTLMPAFANLHAGESVERARELFRGSSKAVALTSGISLGFIGLFADPIVLAWTGVHVPEAVWTLQALVATKFLSMLTGVPTASLRGRGTIALEMGYGIIGTGVLLASIYPLFKLAGYHGVIYARILEEICGAGWFMWAYFRSERLPLMPFVRDVLRVVFSVGLAAVAVLGARLLVPFDIGLDLPMRWEALVSAAVWGTVFGVIAVTAAWFFVLTPEEIKALAAAARQRITVPPPPAV